MPKLELSVITPVRDGIAHVERCLRAVHAQGCASVEHIVVDGASRDGTIEVVRGFAEAHPHVRWISEPDRGQSDAMNKGIALARAPVIGFLNVDDDYAPGTLQRAAAWFRRLPVPSFLTADCRVLGPDGAVLRINRPRRLGRTDLLAGDWYAPHPVNPSAYFYHRCLHERLGGYDTERCAHLGMDLDFLLRLPGHANMVHVDETWGNFRVLPGTKTWELEQSGRARPEYFALLARHRAELPPRLRLLVAAKRLVGFARRARHGVSRRLGLGG
ncbi:MAG: glycosyltransferase family 2 protein [Myxococcota bacterium]|nr:glycosyltransferase family 2 protein [Myxococcota bacterium]